MMKFLKTLLLLITFGSFQVTVGQLQLSEESSISLLTCSPGPELHAAFGHSAIRVKDHYQGIDVVFNYGTFDFEAPNFYLKFLKGELDYFLSTSSFIQFANYYQYYGRGVIEQKLNLNSIQKQELLDALNEALLPKNRFYRYEFLENNCATKIPEIISSATGLEITYTDVTVWAIFFNLINSLAASAAIFGRRSGPIKIMPITSRARISPPPILNIISTPSKL